jgi:hypothetical protein
MKELFSTIYYFRLKLYRISKHTCYVFFLFFENRALYVKMWEGGWTDYIVAFPLPHCLDERATMLRHTYVARLVIFNILSTNVGFPTLTLFGDFDERNTIKSAQLTVSL